MEQRGAQIELVVLRRIDTPEQHGLIADVAEPEVEQGIRGAGDERRDLPGVVRMRVQSETDAAGSRLPREPPQPLQDVALEEVLRKRREALGGETDVTHVREVEQFRHELLEPDNGDVRDVAARHEHVPDLRRGAHVVEHRPPPLSFANGKPVLHDLLRALSYEIHPRAVPAVLWARSDELDEHLCRIAVREALHGPHVPLVQAVATGPRMARPLLVALRVGREHVAPDGVAQRSSSSIVFSICGGTSSGIVA